MAKITDLEVVGQVNIRRCTGLSLRQHVAEGEIEKEKFEISLCLGSGSLRVHFQNAKPGKKKGGEIEFQGQYLVGAEDLIQAAWEVEKKRRAAKNGGK